MLAVSRFRSRACERPSHRSVRVLLLGLMALALVAVTGARAQADANTASISGTVTDSGDHPITTQDICVTAVPTEATGPNESELVTKTDSGGNYTIAGLAAGPYVVYFADCEGSARNDLPQYYGHQTEYNSATTITLSEGQAKTGADTSLTPATSISGHVYGGSSDSTPLANICVYAIPNSNGIVYTPSVQTNATGTYTLKHLTPSVAYTLEFYDCNSTLEYLTQYYDDASEYDSATAVTPTLANPLTGIDAHMEKGASISGTVTDSGGHPITTQDICVDAYSTNTNGDQYNDYGETKTGAGGQYKIGGLAPGSYDVSFYDCYESSRNDTAQYYDHQANAAFAEAITLGTRQEQTGIDASLEPATTISGHVYGGPGNATPLKDICVDAYSMVGGYYDYYGPTVQTNAEGAYTLTHIVPNVGYDINFYDCNTKREYLTQYYDGASDTAQATTVTPTTAPLTGIDAHMEKGASISGTVTDSGGHPITTQDICVSAELTVDNYTETAGYATTDASGNYTIAGLSAGSYKVYFSDCGNDSRNDLPQYYDGASTLSAASLVVLSASGVEKGIDASMQPATTISGHAFEGAGDSTPLQGVCVEAVPVSSSEGQGYHSAYTAADGSYTISHITPSAEYWVSFTDCNFPKQYLSQYYNGATILTPTIAAPSTEIDAHMEKGASISGTVTDSGGHPITTQEICVSVNPSNSNSYSENDYGYATTDSSGNYTIGALAPGPYDVKFEDCDYSGNHPRNDLPQYYHDQPASTTAEPVLLSAKQEQTGIDASLQPATSISGHVYGSSDTSKPLAGICVEASATSGGDGFGSSSSTETASSGSYTLLHLEPSTGYKVEFYECSGYTYESAYESQYYDGASESSSADTVTPTASPTAGIDAHLAKNPLQVRVTGGPANGAASNSTEASFAFAAVDTKATFACELDGRSFTPCTSPIKTSTLDDGVTLSEGFHTFSVEASDAGKTGPATTVDWVVDTSGPTSTSGGSTPAGGTFSSDPGQPPSGSTPVITEVTVPTTAEITLTNEPVSTPSENGYTVFGQQIRIAATDSGGSPVTGTAADPIALTFSLDAAEIPPGTNLEEITVLRNGSPAANCTKSGTAEPDPCVSSRTALPGGGVQLTVLTTHCSLWNFALGAGSNPPPEGTHTEETHHGGTSTSTETGSSGSAGPAGPSPSAMGGVLGSTTSKSPAPAKPLTRAQKLARVIAACHKLKKSKRAKCITSAKKRYTPSKPKPPAKKRKG
jgi:hypothetical protein